MNLGLKSEEVKELKKYYVYELVCGETGRVFYVGKGQEYRVKQHEIDANKDNLHSDKLKAIREIKDSGSDVITRIIGRYDNENEAYAVESTLIHWVYGIDSLTNISGGHGCETIRDRGVFSVIEGIDIPKRERSFNGEYSSDEVRKVKDNDIEKFMFGLRETLESRLNVVFSDVCLAQSRFSEIYYDLCGVRIAILTNNSKAKRIKVEIRPVNMKTISVGRVIELCEKDTRIESRNYGKYALIPSHKPTIDIDVVCERFIETKNMIYKALSSQG